MEKKRMDWIDGLKLVACVCVFFSHYQGFFFGACRADLGYGSVFKRIMGSSYNIFTNGNFWMCMFCVISGYFACKKRVETIKDLIAAIFNRYFRFFIPVLGANLVAFLFAHLLGFDTQKYSMIFDNSWIGEYYDFKVTLWIVVRASIKLTCELNSPLWMLRPLFFGTCFIYVCKYLLGRVKSVYVNTLVFAIWIILLVFFPHVHDIYLYSFITCMGCFLKVIWDKNLLHIEKQWVNIGILISLWVLLGSIQGLLFHAIEQKITIASYVNNYFNTLYSFFLLVAVNNHEKIKQGLGSGIFKQGQNLSFGIYVMHWLVISSISLKIYGLFISYMPVILVFFLNLVISFGIICILAVLFHELVEVRLVKVLSLYTWKKTLNWGRKGE